ncbi:MAG: 50S ribosomal protein L18 [Clostridiales bacterium]|jgi:large subunit ribosomal protein L18|nr:50S ribosomal protein L18 [Clostridiales bacterium]
MNKKNKNFARQRRQMRVRGKVAGTAERPRLNVFRSLKNIYAQLIDDDKGVTLASASTKDKGFAAPIKGNKAAAREVGKALAERATKIGITEVVFDRAGYIYHGRVAELAEGAREGGLQF